MDVSCLLPHFIPPHPPPCLSFHFCLCGLAAPDLHLGLQLNKLHCKRFHTNENNFVDSQIPCTTREDQLSTPTTRWFILSQRPSLSPSSYIRAQLPARVYLYNRLVYEKRFAFLVTHFDFSALKIMRPFIYDLLRNIPIYTYICI